jgi:hypothetical protein
MVSPGGANLANPRLAIPPCGCTAGDANAAARPEAPPEADINRCWKQEHQPSEPQLTNQPAIFVCVFVCCVHLPASALWTTMLRLGCTPT